MIMNEMFSYEELRDIAMKAGVSDNRVHIGVWARLSGFTKIRKQINHVRKTYYTKLPCE